MGFIAARIDSSTFRDPEDTADVGASTQVSGPSVTRIRDSGDRPTYGEEIGIELGFWAREIPETILVRVLGDERDRSQLVSETVIAPGWSHRWNRLECRYDPPPRTISSESVSSSPSALARQHEEVVRERKRVEELGPQVSSSLVSSLLTLGDLQRALGLRDEAIASYTEARRWAESSPYLRANPYDRRGTQGLVAAQQAQLCLARIIQRVAETRFESSSEEASDGYVDALRSATDARVAFEPLVDAEPRTYSKDLIRCLQCLHRIYDAIGDGEAAAEIEREIVERGSIAPGETLIVAETPLVGRRRFDLAIFRRALNQRKPYFGKKLARRVAKRAKEIMARSNPALPPYMQVNMARLVLQELENPKTVRRDPFVTKAEVLVAGISVPGEAFAEEPADVAEEPRGPSHDYIPNWSDRSHSRTGWMIGVCSDPHRIHAKIMTELDPVVTQAMDGRLWIFPPKDSRRPPVCPAGAIIGKAAKQMASSAVWLAMAGTRRPNAVGQPIAPTAIRLLNDLLYNYERRVHRHLQKHVVIDDRGPGPDVPTVPLAKQRAVIDDKIEKNPGVAWVTDAVDVLDMCSPQVKANDEHLMALGAIIGAYELEHKSRSVGGDEVIDYVYQWIREAVRERFRSESGASGGAGP